MDCFHCGDPVPSGRPYTVEIDGEDRHVCCPGCQAVALFIRDSGLSDYYTFRTATGLRPDAPEPAAVRREWLAYDRPAMLDRLTTHAAPDRREAIVLVEGVRCAACGWLIERALGGVAGIESIQVNPATARAHLAWDPAACSFSRALDAIARLGYRPHPVEPGAHTAIAQRERRQALKRLAVAGLGMMQVMTYAVSMYAGAFQGMDETIREFLRLISLLVATPVVLYSGIPFFTGAWRDLRAGRPGMDVPVALAIGGAYVASLFNSFRGTGEVYFDSVTMFVFFLSLGRFAEMAARHRAGETSDALARLTPATALRLTGNETAPETVGVSELVPGDLVLIRTGDPFPTDGRLVDARTYVDESMLTGESRPVCRTEGAQLIGGSLNLGDPVRMRIERIGQDTVASHVARLLQRAQASRPRMARTADRVARWFVAGVLVTAALVAIVWAVRDPSVAFPIVLSVLVVTCPCALSLATPTALTAATSRLARSGLLVTRSDALEQLSRADRLVFDKTGTLTSGRISLSGVKVLSRLGEARCMRIAASLESGSEHPLARAFRDQPVLPVDQLRVFPGRGIEGRVDGRLYRVGRPEFVTGIASSPQQDLDFGDEDPVMLGDTGGALATFRLEDPLREGAAQAVKTLHALGLETEILSGDAEAAVARVARATAIERFQHRRTPEQKLERIHRIQADDHVVAMVGDGVNDAPVLAGADVSMAMAGGAPLAQTSADMILIGETLRPLCDGVRMARRCVRTIRQNLTWAILYNAVALPLAATGMIAPWMAAIGMSASSLLVILNSMRLAGATAPAAPAPAIAAGTAGRAALTEQGAVR